MGVTNRYTLPSIDFFEVYMLRDLTETEKARAFGLFDSIIQKFKEQKELCVRMKVGQASMSAWRSIKSGKIPEGRVNGSDGLVAVGREVGVECDLKDFRPDIWEKWHTYEAPESSA